MIKEFIRLQTPARALAVQIEPCQIIMLSIGDDNADKEMAELIKKCGGVKQ